MFCNGCGAELDGQRNFCPKCGRDLRDLRNDSFQNEENESDLLDIQTRALYRKKDLEPRNEPEEDYPKRNDYESPNFGKDQNINRIKDLELRIDELEEKMTILLDENMQIKMELANQYKQPKPRGSPGGPRYNREMPKPEKNDMFTKFKKWYDK